MNDKTLPGARGSGADLQIQCPPSVKRVTQEQNLAHVLLQVDKDEADIMNKSLKRAWENSDKLKTYSSDDEWTLLAKYIYILNGMPTWESIPEHVAKAIRTNIDARFRDKSENITNFLISALKEASYKQRALKNILEEEFRNRGEAKTTNVDYYMKLYTFTTTGLFQENETLKAQQDEKFSNVSSIGGESKDNLTEMIQLRF